MAKFDLASSLSGFAFASRKSSKHCTRRLFTRAAGPRRLRCESLQRREMMAADVDLNVRIDDTALVAPAIESVDFSKPVSPADYQDALGIGFSTDWFKNSRFLNDATDTQLQEAFDDLKTAGFSNLRLRTDASLAGFPDDGIRAGDGVDRPSMNRYLAALDQVLDTAESKAFPVTISWLHHNAESRASQQDRNNFVSFWRQVARHTQDRSYAVSFNLMTEVGRQAFDPAPNGYGLYDDVHAFNRWSETALNAIRAFGDPGSHHPQRNVIISAPRNTQQDSLRRIDADILTDDHVLVEYHAYAAGAKDSGRNAWSGNGSAEDRARLTDRIDSVMAFTDETGVPIYWGAWMPMDNKTSTLSQREVENFATFFAETLGEAGIPWSMNKLQNYYDVETGDWVRNTSFGSGSDRKEINVQRALAAAVDAHEST
ncbi:MAG: cellulase family glycosylhydrolase, partial [Planctomycetota bacterium]